MEHTNLFTDMKLSDALTLTAKPEAHHTVELIRTTYDYQMLITANLKAIMSNYDHPQNIVLQYKDFISVKSNAKLIEQNFITPWEFNFPGRYLIQENETIDSIVKRAGGFTDKAFLSGLVFKRDEVATKTQQGYNTFFQQEQKRITLDPDLTTNKSGCCIGTKTTSKRYRKTV